MKVIIREPGSEEAAALWNGADAVMTSRLAYPEARAALAAATRSGRLTEAANDAAKESLLQRWSALGVIEVSASVCEAAGELAEPSALRGYDAVHLASALLLAEAGVIVATWDRDLSVAAGRAGLGVAGVR